MVDLCNGGEKEREKPRESLVPSLPSCGVTARVASHGTATIAGRAATDEARAGIATRQSAGAAAGGADRG